jgi:hypothetical protein
MKENSSTPNEPCVRERSTKRHQQDTGKQDGANVRAMVEGGADKSNEISFFSTAEFELKLRIYSSQSNQNVGLTSVWADPNVTLADLRKNEISKQLVHIQLPKEYIFLYYDQGEDLYAVVSRLHEHRYKAKDLATHKLGLLPSSPPNTCKHQESWAPNQILPDESSSETNAKQEPESEDNSQFSEDKDSKWTRNQRRLHRNKTRPNRGPRRQKIWQRRHKWKARSRARRRKQPYCYNMERLREVGPYYGGCSTTTESCTAIIWSFEIRGGSHGTKVSCTAREWWFDIPSEFFHNSAGSPTTNESSTLIE